MMRNSILLLTLSALVWPLTPATAKDFWIKDKTSGCQIWSDEAAKANDVVTWSGKCKDNKASGEGKLTWTQDGKPAGTYVGFMKDGKLNGPGTLRLVVKGGTNELIGIFKDGDIENGGLFKDAAGNIYEGDIKDGKPHGAGYQKIGEVEYAGNFENGLRKGPGLLLGPNTAYLGEFDNDVASGSGTLEDETGGRYHGQFKNGKPHGFGTYVTKDGAVYQGRFVNGKAQGAMLVTAKGAGKSVVETWKDGKKVK